MHWLTLATREIKLGFRNPWAYSFLVLFALFSLALLLIQSQNQISGYTSTTAGMLNLILYLLPLMTLLLGSFSLTSEKEEGSWQLLATYPLSTSAYMLGKYAGLAVVLLVIASFGFGLSGVLGIVVGKAFAPATFALFFVFSALLTLLFLAISLVIGTFAQNRWQALTYGVGLWFFLILAWPTVLITVLGFVPYLWIKPLLVFFTFLNPAELVRLFTVIQMGGGSILGPEYYQWVQWVQSPAGIPIFFGVCLIWIATCLGLAISDWESRRYRE